jgi:hypothetical protein
MKYSFLLTEVVPIIRCVSQRMVTLDRDLACCQDDMMLDTIVSASRLGDDTSKLAESGS